jgi:hypothetical protein
MRKVYLIPLMSIFLGVFNPYSGLAQCSSSCPAGAITTLPASGTIAAGSTYCISGNVNNSSTAYTIAGTLIVQSGSLSLGAVTLMKTGSIVVNAGAKLSTGNFTGESTAPASVIANVTVCTTGFLSISGSFNQWETNFVLNDYAILLVTGSWTSSSTDVYAKIGMGALVELCATLNINTNGFFVETSSSPSYLVTGGGVTESVINGFISTKQNSSLIKWTTLAPAAFVSHPVAYTCYMCGNSSMAPPGTTPGTCGAVANSYILTVLYLPPPSSPPALPEGGTTLPASGLAYPDPARDRVYLRLPDPGKYTVLSLLDATGRPLLEKNLSVPGTDGTIVCLSLPASLPMGIYFLRQRVVECRPLSSG